MAVEQHEGGIVIDGEHIELWHLHSLVSRLALSITMGRKAGLMGYVANLCGSSGRTTKGVLEDYVVWLYENGVTLNAQWGTVDRALGTERSLKLKRRVIPKKG